MPAPSLVEYLTFVADAPLGAVVSETWAWKVLDYTSIRRRTRIGENRAIPGASGGAASPPRVFVPRQWDEQTVVLTWRINGYHSPTGTPYADPFEGVDLNHQVLLDNVINSLDLRAVTFTDRHGAVFGGDVVIDNWEPAVDPSSGGEQILAPMTLKIPAGWLEPVTP